MFVDDRDRLRLQDWLQHLGWFQAAQTAIGMRNTARAALEFLPGALQQGAVPAAVGRVGGQSGVPLGQVQGAQGRPRTRWRSAGGALYSRQ